MTTHTEVQVSEYPVPYVTAKIDNLGILYRDAGPKDAPVILLLHGFVGSSRVDLQACKLEYSIVSPK